jgi:drug/metabolite transporter (DMT)-like permease
MQDIIFALVSCFGWAAGNAFGVVAARKFGAYPSALWGIMVRAILSSFYLPFALTDLSNFTTQTFVVSIVLGVVWVLGVLASYKSLSSGNASVAGTIFSSFPFLTVILSIGFLAEKIDTATILAILTIFVGLLLCSISQKRGKLLINDGVIYGTIAMLCFGVYFTFIKIVVQKVGWFWPGYITVLLFPVILYVTKLRHVSVKKPTLSGASWSIVANSALLLVGDFSYNFAVSKGLTSVVAPIAGASPALFVILTFIFFKGILQKQQIVGILATVIGIVLLAIFSKAG